MLLTRETLVGILQKMDDTLAGVSATADEILAAINADEPDQLDEAFPSDDHLRQRRTRFLAKVAAYIAPGARVKNDGGWTDVTRDDIQELYNLVHELRDLRYELDGDADPTIQVTLVNRKEGRLHTFFEPYSPDRIRMTGATAPPPTQKEMAEYRQEILRIASWMSSTVQHMTNVMSADMRFNVQAMEAENQQKIDLGILQSIIPHLSYEDGLTRFAEYITKYKRHSEGAGVVRKLLAEKIIEQTAEDAKAIDALIDAGQMDEAKAAIRAGVAKWFSGAFEAQRNRYNGLIRQERLAMKAAGKRDYGEYISLFEVEV